MEQWYERYPQLLDAERAAKEKFLKTTVPAWLEKAKENGRLAQI